MNRVPRQMAVSLALVALFGAPRAVAQESTEAGAERERSMTIEEIVVTAQRREQSLQEVPIAVTAFGADAIQRSDLDVMEKLQFQVPGLTFAAFLSAPQITLRGVGSDLSLVGSEPGIAFYLDGVYMPRATTSSSVYADLERIEVLRGPQGTLYGRNSTGGLIHLYSKEPTGETEGFVSLLYGSANRVRARAGVSFPISETLSARLSYAGDQHDGYRKNRTRGGDLDARDHDSARGTLRWTPTEDLTVVLRADWSRDRDTGPPFAQFLPVSPFLGAFCGTDPIDCGGSTGDDPQHARLDSATSDKKRNKLFSSTITWDLHDLPLVGDATLKHLTAYQRYEWHREADHDATDILWINMDSNEQGKAWTQELTLTSASDGKLDWILGGYFFKDRGNAYYNFPAEPTTIGFDGVGVQFTNDVETWAAFANLTYHVTERLRTTLGARFTREKKDYQNINFFDLIPGLRFDVCAGFTPTPLVGVKSDDDWSRWTPKFGVDFDLTDDMMVYAAVSRGFKAGGANAAACSNLYDQELLWSYELGVKSDWFDERLRVNLVGFFYDYEDYQANRFLELAAFIENASDAEILGVEGEIQVVPFEGFRVSGGFSYQNAQFEDYFSEDQLDSFIVKDLKGNKLPKSSELSWFIGSEYTLAGELGSATLRHELSWRDQYWFTAFNASHSEQSSYTINNARLIFATVGGSLEERFGDLELHFYVNNWGDKDIRNNAVDASTQGGTLYQFADPRNLGVELRYRF